MYISDLVCLRMSPVRHLSSALSGACLPYIFCPFVFSVCLTWDTNYLAWSGVSAFRLICLPGWDTIYIWLGQAYAVCVCLSRLSVCLSVLLTYFTDGPDFACVCRSRLCMCLPFVFYVCLIEILFGLVRRTLSVSVSLSLVCLSVLLYLLTGVDFLRRVGSKVQSPTKSPRRSYSNSKVQATINRSNLMLLRRSIIVWEQKWGDAVYRYRRFSFRDVEIADAIIRVLLSCLWCLVSPPPSIVAFHQNAAATAPSFSWLYEYVDGCRYASFILIIYGTWYGISVYHQ